MTYLLDTMIVSYFLDTQREKELSSAAQTCKLAIVDEVRVELANDPDRGGAAFAKWLATSGISVRSIDRTSPASATLASLLRPNAPKDGLGERASIALAAHDADLTFVTHDKGAMKIALPELWMHGERLLVFAPFLRRMHDLGAVRDPQVIDDVFDRGSSSTPGQPTWWPSWRAALKALS